MLSKNKVLTLLEIINASGIDVANATNNQISENQFSTEAVTEIRLVSNLKTGKLLTSGIDLITNAFSLSLSKVSTAETVSSYSVPFSKLLIV